MKVFINVFWGAKNFHYNSSVIPMVGDLMPSVKAFDNGFFIVKDRIISTDETEGLEVVTITVEKKN